MGAYTFDDFRKVLRKSGFAMIRSKKHETWRKVLSDGTILVVRVSHQHAKDIDVHLFHRMLKQAGLGRDEFERLLKG